jgi:HEAT repeat protein
MKIRIFITMLLMVLLVPFAARAIDQATIDNLVFLLTQPEVNVWGDGTFDDTTLYEGLTAIHRQAVDQADDMLFRRVLWAMGETGLTAFVPTLVDSMDDEPIVVSYALGKIPSEAGVYALIGKLDDEDMYLREAVAYALGDLPYTSDFTQAQDDAVLALRSHLLTESEDWVKETINAAITMIETGEATVEAYEEPAQPTS